MNNFTDLVRRLHSIENNDAQESTGSTASPEKKAIAETANVLRAFDAIEQQTRPERTAVKEAKQAIADGDLLGEKAVSKSQQQAAGAALAAKRGDAPKSKLKGASKEMMKMSTKELEKYAGTAHKGLPDKKESIEESEDLTSDLKQRFAQFMKSERTAGAAIEEMESVIGEATAEYKVADNAFHKMLAGIETLEKMVREGSLLERKIAEAGGDISALEDMRNALRNAYSACEEAHYGALGGIED